MKKAYEVLQKLCECPECGKQMVIKDIPEKFTHLDMICDNHSETFHRINFTLEER